jgi:ABC-type nitrate/sulfonate/bicarbonate transport system substrate-binding protein
MGSFPSLLLFFLGCASGPGATPEGATNAPAGATNAPAGAAAPGAPAAVATTSTAGGPGLEPIRIGWQTSWATEGQLTAVLIHTDILAKNGFVGEFSGFTYGGPLNEGALAGAVDVLFTADQPALSLAAKAPSWGIIGRLMYNRVGTFVPPDSPVTAPADLKGKKLVVPFGAAAQREALAAISAAGLDPKADVRVANLGIEEILALARSGSHAGQWGDVDAAAAWDPTFAELETSGRVHTIATSVVTSVVVMNDAYVATHTGADARFLSAMEMAYDYYRQHPAQADRWFQLEARLRFTEPVLTAAAKVEPNLSAKDASGIRVHLTDEDVAGIATASAFMSSAGLLKEPLAVDAVVRPVARVAPAVADASGVTVTRP